MDDRLDLQDVMLRYAAAVDERDFDAYASIFADEVEVVGFERQPIVGVAAWMAYVQQALERFEATQHMLGPVLATVDGDTAHCRTDLQALHRLKDRAGGMFVLWATYRTDLRRTTDGWKIVRHELVRRAAREW